MRKIGISIWVILLFMVGVSFAANPSESDLKKFSTKLENHKNTLMKSLDASKAKLDSIARENKRFSETRYFNAAVCLGALTGEVQDLDYSLLTNTLKSNILNEYIKLDGDIKRFGFGLSTPDNLIFGNSLDAFYNQNALKVTQLENEYYLKSTQVKKNYEQYIENNKDLLGTLAAKIDAVQQVDRAFTGAEMAFTGLNAEIAKQTNAWQKMEQERLDMLKNITRELDEISAKLITQHALSGELQARFMIHRNNFLNKFDLESKKALYSVFSNSFDYSWYLTLKANHQELHQKFDDAKGALNCPILLTSSLNFNPYLKDLQKNSEALISGMNSVKTALKDGKMQLKSIETQASEVIGRKIKALNNELVVNFRLMLESELPKKVEKADSAVTIPSNTPAQSSESPVHISVPQQAQPVVRAVFTQAFKKGQYHTQVKALQTALQNRGLYAGTINGVYDKATIEAVYQFQLKHGIVTGKEKKKTGYGRFGTQTRAKVNALLAQ